MPPQAFALAVGLAGPLGWNYQRSRVGKPTISMFMRRHPVVFVAGVITAHGVVDGWLVPHILKRP